MTGKPKLDVANPQVRDSTRGPVRPPGEDDGVRVERVRFGSSGEVIIGDLYSPTSDGDRRPAVVVAGAWATVKEQMARGYAREMAARGYIALAFDFRSWGQ